jgi:nucleoside-diphosphate-sugar epimerase
MDKKNLLITGFPGWLSSRLLDVAGETLSASYNVICLVKPGVEAQSLEAFKNPVKIVFGDITEYDSLVPALKDIDVVIHAAGILHVKRISDFYAVNRDGTHNLLKACVENKVKRFIFISSNAVHGYSKDAVLADEETKCNPKSHYGLSKYQAEQLVNKFNKENGLETIILRPAMFYGPPVAQRHIGVYRRIRKGFFPVCGSGNYIRSLTYIDNLVDSILLVLKTPDLSGKTYYITDENPYTTLQVILEMANALGTRVRIVRLPVFIAKMAFLADRVISKLGIYVMNLHLVGESTWNVAYSTGKAKRELGYDPKVGIKEGYRRTVAWCKERNLLD